jgi:Icc-related predicted phosphoesterase
MKILVVADAVVPGLAEGHEDIPEIKGVELIISCGDLPPEYLTLLSKRTGVPVYYVMGNHDIRYEASPPEGCLDIHRRVVFYHGFRILGLAGSRWYNGGVNQYTEGQMRNFIFRLWFGLWRTKGVDIVVTHAPPRKIGDAEDPCHRGFRCFCRLVERYQPAYFLHGHIHKLFNNDSERIYQLGETRIINCYGFYILNV